MNQDGTLSLLIIITFLSEARFQLSLLQKLTELTLTRTRVVRVLISPQLLTRFPSIPAKSPKEINKIAKYFKKNEQSKGKNNQKYCMLKPQLQSIILGKF